MQRHAIAAGRDLPHDIGGIKLKVWQVPSQHVVWHLHQVTPQAHKVSVCTVYPNKESWTVTTCFKATCKLSQWAGVGVGRAWRRSDGEGSRMSSRVAVLVRHFMKGHLPGPAYCTHMWLSGVNTARQEAIM